MVLIQENQKLKISTGIRNNLMKYQESKIFREIIQNAEDAGANQVIIKLDDSRYGTDKLFYSKDHEFYNNLKDLQGPSILIYNNAVFKDSDWEGVKFIGEGSKKKDMLSIGNFGLGFNSTYHISDCPQIVSGDKFWFLDPLRLIGKGIRCKDFTKQTPEFNYDKYEDQFSPFLYFGCDMKTYFSGTIIRLPLRLIGNELKEKPVTLKGCVEILQEFYKEMSEIPIFLKVISSITLCINSGFNYKVQIMNNAQVQEQRKKVADNLKSIVNNEMNDKTSNYEFNDIISKKNQDDFKSTYRLDMKTTLIENGTTQSKEISFIVSQGILVSNELNDLVVDSEIKLISYGGVAIPIKTSDGNKVELYEDDFKAKPFCFLPIGNQVISSKSHVFGYYILSDARSEIQYSCQSSRQNTQEYKINKWNQFISKQVVPYFYIEALKHMTQFQIDLTSYFPYQCLISGSGNSTFEKDFSFNTMNLIFKESLFLNYFKDNTTSPAYIIFQESVKIKEDTPLFISEYLRSSNIPTILLNESFINYLQNNNIELNLLMSPSVLCYLLSSNQLKEYSQEILNYLCNDKAVIESGRLNNLKLLPINQSNSDNGVLNNLGSFQHSNSSSQSNFVIVSKNIYSLLKKMQVSLDYILDESQMGENFNRNIELIKKYYNNIKSIDINFFLSLINIESASLYHQEIWNTIDRLYNFHSNIPKVNEQIVKLPIFAYYKNKSSTEFSFTSYGGSKVFSKSFFNHLSDEITSIFNKLNFIIIETTETSKRFLTYYDNQEKSTNKLIIAINNIGSLDKILSSDEIPELKIYLFNLLNQSGFNNWSSSFFSTPFHACIGNPNKQFTSISSESICIKFMNIYDYEINGKEIVLLDNYIYDSIHDFYFPTRNIFRKEIEVYLHYLLPNISRFTKEKSINIITDFVYKHLSSLKENEIFNLKLNWILTTENKFIPLNKLYHLNNLETEIYQIINPQYVIHQDLSDVSSHLLKYGLIKPISPDTVVDSAIKYLQSINDQKVYQLLLDYFDKNDTSVLYRFNKSKFIPSTLVQTYKGFEAKTPLLSISEVTTIENKDITFSVKYPVKFNKDSAIYKYIKDDKDSVFEHWYKLLQLRNSIQNSNFNLSSIFDKIYKTVKKLSPKTNILEQIKNLRVLWYQDKFINTNRLYIEGDYLLTPFFYKINLELYPIFKSFNMVKKNLTLDDYYSIINEIQEKKESPNKDIIQIYCYCLKLISRNNLNQTIKNENIKLLPTVNNQLIEFDYVLFSEIPIPNSDGYYQLHKEIDLDTVENLKINKLSQKLQEIYALSFGQKEELVPRLQNIIKDYRVEGFFNEMIQNASDANATEFKMFLDENNYSSHHIKSKDVPDIDNYLSNSLIIYNNSTFSDRDIENVQHISSSYKKNEKNVIGFNGLGINSAYNFSNTISILSGKYLMILDPLISHIPVSLTKATGCKYEIKKCFEQYKDYFQPFLRLKKLLNIDFENGEFNGTIIRLPLKKSCYKEKNISNALYNKESILKLFREFQNNKLYNCMLFTNINDIEIGKFSGDNYETLYKTTKNQPKLLDSTLFNNMLDVIPMDVHEHSYTILDIDHQNKEEKKFIVGSSKVFENNEIFLQYLPEENKIKKFLNLYTDEKRKPYGSIAFEISITDNSYIADQTSKSFCYLPFKDIDLPFNVNGFFNITTSRDIYETSKAMYIEVVDLLKNKVDTNIQQQESFLIYWNTLLIEELITPIFIKTLILYKENYISINKVPDVNNYMELVQNYYKLFPTFSPHNNSIFQKLVTKFYNLYKHIKFNYLLPHPTFYSNKKIAQFYLLLDDKKNTIISEINERNGHNRSGITKSVLKCFSNYGNIFFITEDLSNLLELNSSLISPSLLSKAITNRELNENIITKDEYLFEILCYLGMKLANGCQLLKLNNGKAAYIYEGHNSIYMNDKNNLEYILYKEDYYNLIKDNSKFKKDEIFIDINYSNKIKERFHLNEIINFNILVLNPLQFFLKVIYPKYDSFSVDQTKLILEFLKNFFFDKDGKFIMQAFQNDHKIIKESPLIPSNYKGIIKFYPIRSLYSFKFKNMFDLPYPLDCFNTQQWDNFFKEFHIRTHLNEDNISNEFKKLSNDFYLTLKEGDKEKEKELLKKSHYLWNNVPTEPPKYEANQDLFNSILELNIVPTERSNILGSKPRVPLLGRISNCYDSKNEKLLFTVKFKSGIHIQYPEGYSQFTNEDVYENLVNILSDHNQWPKKNNQHNDTIFELLRANLQYLEDQIRGKHRINNLDQFRIVSLPIQDSNQSIPFENIIFENTNVTPFFTSLPSFYLSYPNLFKSLGVQNINNHQSIINRLNQFLHQELNQTELKSFKPLYDILVSNLNNNSSNNIDISTIPILTDINFLKEKRVVIFIDNIDIQKRVNISGRFWSVHKMYHENLKIWSIPKLSNLVTESINSDLTKLKNNQSLEFEIFNSEFKNDPVLNTLISNDETRRRILKIKIRYGTIYVKTLLNSDNSDISNNQPTSYFYSHPCNGEDDSGTLYLDENSDLYSILEVILGFDSNSLKSIFNRITAYKNNSRLKKKTENFNRVVHSYYKSYGITSGIKDNNNSQVFYKIASEKNNIAKLLHDSGKFDDVFIYCNKSILYSIKSVLEFQHANYNQVSAINDLKMLSNNLLDLSNISEFQSNLYQFKTSLCQYSNQENSEEILDLSDQYLRRARSLIHN